MRLTEELNAKIAREVWTRMTCVPRASWFVRIEKVNIWVSPEVPTVPHRLIANLLKTTQNHCTFMRTTEVIAVLRKKTTRIVST